MGKMIFILSKLNNFRFQTDIRILISLLVQNFSYLVFNRVVLYYLYFTKTRNKIELAKQKMKYNEGFQRH